MGGAIQLVVAVALVPEANLEKVGAYENGSSDCY